MSFQVPNSNQFASWIPGTYLPSADYLQGIAGSNLPATQDQSLTDETEITAKLILRRNGFENANKPKGFVEANDLPNLPYKEQIAYINKLQAKDIRDWYGASAEDMEAVTSYLLRNNATIVETNQEQRTVTAKLTLGNFRSAFLAGKDEIILNKATGYSAENNLYYYNPNDYADSFLSTEGSDGESFAKAIIGSRFVFPETDIEVVNKSIQQEENKPFDKPKFGLYPLEIAAQYNFPDQAKTEAGKNVGIGIVGTGGAEFDKYMSINNALKKYLKAQGISTKKLGRSVNINNTPSDPTDSSLYEESSLDYSILRSLAPKSDIYVSEDAGDTKLYESYAQLIYEKAIDVISSSSGLNHVPGVFNQTEALKELMVDGLLRGKTIIQASGDVGTANNSTLLPNGLPIPDPQQTAAVLSVGGTSLNRNAQELIWPRSNVSLPTAFPPSFQPGTLDALTGLVGNQYAWNSTKIQPLAEKDLLDSLVYPTFSDQFSSQDFIGTKLLPGALDNAMAHSGVQDSFILEMPAYQKENLEQQWLGTGRRYPDVSALADSNAEKGSDPTYYFINIASNNEKTDFVPELKSNGGTSAAAPLVAGLLANLTSYIRERFGKKQKLGLINPLLYETYNSKGRKKMFFDVPAGSNNANVFTVATSPENWSGYTVMYEERDSGQKYLIPVNGTGTGGQLDTNLSSTGKGFDAATGLGSINGEGLLDQLGSVFSQL